MVPLLAGGDVIVHPRCCAIQASSTTAPRLPRRHSGSQLGLLRSDAVGSVDRRAEPLRPVPFGDRGGDARHISQGASLYIGSTRAHNARSGASLASTDEVASSHRALQIVARAELAPRENRATAG